MIKNSTFLDSFIKKTTLFIKNLFNFFKKKRKGEDHPFSQENPPLLHNDEFYLDEEGKDFITHMLQARQLTAEDVMVPRVDIVALDEAADLKEITTLFEQKPHHYFPVYRNSLDEIIGAVHIKELFIEISHSSLKKIPFKLEKSLKKVLFVSPAIRLFDLLQLLQKEKTTMALVVDEYGGVDGLISIHDILKELISDFENSAQFDASMKLVHRADGSYLADGRLELEELENKFSSFLTKEEKQEEIETLGGLVSFLFGRVPHKGETIKHTSGLEFEVVEADPRRVKMVIIRYTENDFSEEEE